MDLDDIRTQGIHNFVPPPLYRYQIGASGYWVECHAARITVVYPDGHEEVQHGIRLDGDNNGCGQLHLSAEGGGNMRATLPEWMDTAERLAANHHTQAALEVYKVVALGAYSLLAEMPADIGDFGEFASDDIPDGGLIASVLDQVKAEYED